MKLRNVVIAFFLSLSVVAVSHAADQKNVVDKINSASKQGADQASLTDSTWQHQGGKKPGSREEILSKDVGLHPDMKKLPPKGSYYEYDALGRITRIIRIK